MTGKITIREAAQIANVSTMTIRNWIDAGELSPVKNRSELKRGKRSVMSVDLKQLMALLERKGLAE